MSLLRIDKLSAGYDDFLVLKSVSLSLEKGNISVLMGPNGAGKSTLLKSIFSITNITSGNVYLKEEDIIGAPSHTLLKKGVSFVTQGRINFPMMSVEENLQMGMISHKDNEGLAKNIQKVYAQFPVLKEKRRLRAYTLSGGQQQMLAIGRALMSDPKLLLMDEPSLGLAPKLVKDVFSSIQKIRDTFDTTILIVEHNLKSLMDIADYGYVMVEGEIIAHDSCANLRNSDIMKQVFVGEFD